MNIFIPFPISLVFKIYFTYLEMYMITFGLPDGSAGEESACKAGATGNTPGWEGPLEKEVRPTPVFFPGESHGQRSLVGYSP